MNGITVRRFPVAHERAPHDFGRRSVQVFDKPHSIADELALARQRRTGEPGAACNYVESAAAGLDFVVLFSYRYYHAWHLARRIPAKAVIVPTAERDPAIGLSIFGPMLRGVRGLMYNSPEERAMIQAAANNAAVPGVVVGVGSEVPERTDPERFRQHVQDDAAVRDLHRPHRREQGLPASCSRTSSATPRRSRAASTSSSSAARSSTCRSIRGSTTSASWTIATSSTRWPRRTC